MRLTAVQAAVVADIMCFETVSKPVLQGNKRSLASQIRSMLLTCMN